MINLDIQIPIELAEKDLQEIITKVCKFATQTCMYSPDCNNCGVFPITEIIQKAIDDLNKLKGDK